MISDFYIGNPMLKLEINFSILDENCLIVLVAAYFLTSIEI